MNNRQLTPAYIFFYLLFSPETWRALIGLIVSYFLTPQLLPPQIAAAGKAMLYVMIATIGYAGSGLPARWITGMLKRFIMGDQSPGK